MNDNQLAMFTAGFFSSATSGVCNDAETICGRNSMRRRNLSGMDTGMSDHTHSDDIADAEDGHEDGCYVSHANTKVMLEKAITLYFEEDFTYATDTMILWWRKASVDLEHCPENSVRKASNKILQ